MKKLLIAIVAACGLVPMLAESPQEYLNRFNEFVNNAQTQSAMSPERYQQTDSAYKAFLTEYDNMKDSMTAEQREDFYRLKGQYARFQVDNKATNLGDKAKATGSNVINKVDSVGADVGRKVGDKTRDLVGKADSIGSNVGEKVGTTVKEGVNYVKGIFEKKK